MATPDRWAPWIEPVALMTGGGPLTVNNATVQAIPGCSITFVPHVNSRLAVSWTLDAECTTAGNVVLIGRLLVNGVGQAANLLAKAPTALDRRTLTQTETVDLMGGTSYTLALDVALTGAGATFLVYPTHTHLGPITAMPNLHS
jgi:hypothetical protein